jgi:hypothetical protein
MARCNFVLAAWVNEISPPTGDDANAKAVIAELVTGIGFDVVDMGGIEFALKEGGRRLMSSSLAPSGERPRRSFDNKGRARRVL